MKKCVIFDLDGTLTNTLESIWKSANLALEDGNLMPQPLDAYRYFVGDGADELIRRCLRAAGDEELSKYDFVRARYSEHFKSYVNYNVEPYDGINELISELKKRDFILAVNTNKPADRAVDVVNEKFGKDTFNMIVGQDDNRRRKPYPDGVLYIMESFGLKNEEVIYIGDTSVDMNTGKSAGVFTVGALWGFRDRQELSENNADAIIEKPLDLLMYIE